MRWVQLIWQLKVGIVVLCKIPIACKVKTAQNNTLNCKTFTLSALGIYYIYKLNITTSIFWRFFTARQSFRSVQYAFLTKFKTKMPSRRQEEKNTLVCVAFTYLLQFSRSLLIKISFTFPCFPL